VIDGGDGDDVVEIFGEGGQTSDDNVVNGGAGEDYIYSRGDISGTKVDGGADDDAIITTGDDGVFAGGAGDDVIVAVGAHSELQGGDGDDLLVAGGLGAQAFARAGSELQHGLEDTLQEAQGTSSQIDGQGSVLDGGAGNDTLLGSFGHDTMIGGDGNDTFITHLGEGNDVIVGGAGTDVLDIRGGVFDGLDGENVNFFFETGNLVDGMNVLAWQEADGSSAQLAFWEQLPDGGGTNVLSRIEIDLSEGGVETVIIGGTEFAMADILANAMTGSGMSMRADMDDAVVDQLEDALDEAMGSGAIGAFDQYEVGGAVTETMEYALDSDDGDIMA
jgi:Ca2+-binding RTX toxin-like protein